VPGKLWHVQGAEHRDDQYIHQEKMITMSKEKQKSKQNSQATKHVCSFALLLLLISLLILPVHKEVFLWPMPPYVPYGLRGLPSCLWPKCNRLMRLGRPWDAVTLSRWCGWWYMTMQVPGGALNLSSTKLLRPWSPRESSPSRKNPHGRTGNLTRDLMISSQKLWPPDHEASHIKKWKVKQSHYRAWQALKFSGGWGSQILRQSAHEGGKVVSPMHRPPLPQGNIPGTHFC
jgi:hypothetical protein